MRNEHSVSGHWEGDFDESAIRAWVEKLRGELRADKVSLGLVFMAPRFFPYAAQVLEILRVHGQIPLLAGCSSGSLIAGAEEVEGNAGIALGLYALPGAELKALYFNQQGVETAASNDGFWQARSGVGAKQTN